MNSRGLEASAWAPKRNGDACNFSRPGDWICSSCGFSNFQWRTECFRCSAANTNDTPKGDEFRGIVNGQPHLMAAIPQASKFSNLGGTVVSKSTQVPATARLVEDLPRPDVNVKNGLSTSCWAPRNYSGRPKQADGGEVWTRTVPIVSVASKPRSTNATLSTSTPPDLGLPYEVQHYILVMIQRILEEGCYDFAFRWIPNILNANNWTCAEAVELSTWRSFLPTALPPNAIVPMPKCSLEDALADAVRIRNSAVHRHLCDNFEIRRMAVQAQDLMSMFSDVTRQSKFRRLWIELNDWDNKSQVDPEASRTRLEQVLREISERPIDDMDWTPNAVSLQEISSGLELPRDVDEYGDKMELD